MVFNDDMMREKLNYIHNNPVKRGYVNRAEYWRCSSAGYYADLDGMIDIDSWV